MAYDEALSERIRDVLKNTKGVVEKKMFGGIAFMLDGNMTCGITGELLMLRLGDEGAAAALKEKHTRAMDFTGRPMKSMVFVEPGGLKSAESLRKWVMLSVDAAKSLPRKKAKK